MFVVMGCLINSLAIAIDSNVVLNICGANIARNRIYIWADCMFPYSITRFLDSTVANKVGE